MTASTYDVEESLPRRSPISQIATTIFVGIPMTLALVVSLVFYCTYECVKFALSKKSQVQPLSDEQQFTTALTNFASIHPPPTQSIDAPAEKKPTEVTNQK